MRTKQQLLNFLGLPEEVFEFVVNFEPPPDPQPPPIVVEGVQQISVPPFYRHKIPKKNKNRGYRVVWEPQIARLEYKALGRRLGSFFKHFLTNYPHPAAYGYLGGRNIRQNAAAHCGHRFLLSTDIASFFSSISIGQIKGLFLDLGICADVAVPLSRFVTIGGVLPLGLATSPVLSNAIFLPADTQLQALADRVGATYTRYSDDLSFSSNGNLPPIEDITKCVQIHGFRLAEGKTKTSEHGQAHYVTGLSISDPSSPHAPREKKRRLRQELYYAHKFGLNSHFQRIEAATTKDQQQNVNRLDGLVKFVAYHEPRQVGRLKPVWANILASSGARPSFEPRRRNGPPFCISIDEAEFQNDQGTVLALGMVVSQHQDQLVSAASEVLNRWLADPWAVGNRLAINKRGLHFTDASEDLRAEFVIRMQTLPFEGYISFGQLSDSSEYEATYLRLVGSIIKRRLMAADSESVLFLIEENSKISQNKVLFLIDQEFNELKLSNNRRPNKITIQFRHKPDLNISFPDFILGILGKYLRSKDAKPNAPMPRDRLLFERLRDRYRLILDADTKAEFSRRRPIEPWM
ncbi:reverse transcriptase family protein [Methylobacterium sp. Leaf106]|uniref:reverse transcriptase family protein n=1 Tax=Methylobacterium sp. Leaf106 TaxID=1736255 RepID=UPI00190FEBA2|nr:reverse transcriptase family protein [Methylobacterium sp. Leaf106]